jgi:hypothetical protein
MPKPIKLASIPAVAKALTFAENQPEYIHLPALMHVDRQTVMFCWQFNWRERLTLLFTGKLWHMVMHCDSPLQPQNISTERPEMFTEKAAR